MERRRGKVVRASRHSRTTAPTSRQQPLFVPKRSAAEVRCVGSRCAAKPEALPSSTDTMGSAGGIARTANGRNVKTGCKHVPKRRAIARDCGRRCGNAKVDGQATDSRTPAVWKGRFLVAEKARLKDPQQRNTLGADGGREGVVWCRIGRVEMRREES